MPNATPFDTQGYGIGDTFNPAALASGSSTPTVRSIDVKGGTKQVATIADRNAIPGDGLARDNADQLRQEGMICFVADRGDGQPETYQLQGGVDNTDWVVFGGAGISAGVTDRTNEEGTNLVRGEIVAQDGTTAKGLRRLVTTVDNNLSRPVALVQAASIAPAATGEVRVIDGQENEVRLGAGHAPALGDMVVGSTVAGEGTIAGSGVNEPTAAGTVVQSVGTIIDTLTYDGAGDFLVLVQINFGHRRVN